MIFLGDLIQHNLSGFDIILGMKWLRIYGAKIDCKDLNVILNNENGQEVCFYDQKKDKPYPLISAMKASRLLC